MSTFPVHTVATAPAASQPLLQGAQEKFGFLPNLLGEFAQSPASLQAYLGLSQAFSQSSLSAVEQQIVLATTSVSNECRYCVAAHSMLLTMSGLAPDQVERVRAGQPLDDARLETLRTTVVEIVTSRGWTSPATRVRFHAAGYTVAQYLDVLVGVTQKTLSNYLNHVAETPLDAPFEKFAWAPTAQSR